LLGGLIHVNSDITLCVVDVLSNLTDADAIGETEDPTVFVKQLMDANLPEM
jgi:hypothetical protein